jgi:two-component system sensor histidine kinase KdpD
MDANRPDPDTLLAAIRRDEARRQRGKLKIYLGMAAGVGKTYAMLEAAWQLKEEGVDLVVGYVETHKRAETEVLLAGLEVIPRQEIEYRGTVLEEMDLDAVLARAPQVALVDELAHTNAPGVRHVKRWQDVLELLDAGIDVHTTVNVQHFESRADAVRQITGVRVHETVPDSLLDAAHEIELVDLSPEDLRKRLMEGKVYTPERAEVAAANFFRTGNLTALREMALRLTAEHVDHKLQDYMELKRIAGPWKSGERLMVAVGPSPSSAQLIRWARRIAYNLEAPWLAVYVETSAGLPPGAKERLAHNLALARDLGGEVVMAAGEDVAASLLRLARQRNVSQIIVGKPRRRTWADLARGGSLVDRLLRASGDIDIYVATGERQPAPGGEGVPGRMFLPPQRISGWRRYLAALLLVGAVTALDWLLVRQFGWLSYLAVGLTELFVVLLVAVYIGRGPALLAALVSAISWNYLFIEPHFTFEITRLEDIILFLLYFVIAIVAGSLAARIRTQERQAEYNAERAMALYTLAHETATAVNMDDVLRTAVTQIGRVFDAEVAILLPSGERLERRLHPASTLEMDEKEFGVALWAFDNGRPAGRFTDALPSARAQYLPLRTPGRTVGAIGIRTRQQEPLAFDEQVLLETFTNQVALVIERELLDEAAEQSAMLRESERLSTTLLNSISHELRTPLATIKGAGGSLLNAQTSAAESTRMELTQTIVAGANRLNRLVENLLDMSRLESGRLQLKREWCDLGEIAGVAAKGLEECFARRTLTISIAPELPLVRVDFGLLEQVLVNLLDNACAYTPEGAHVWVAATLISTPRPGSVEIVVADDGPGIPGADLERVFDKFYRVQGSAAGGTGLGLSISRGLVEAHGGTLAAVHRPGGGVQFIIRLPQDGSPPPVPEAPAASAAAEEYG